MAENSTPARSTDQDRADRRTGDAHEGTTGGFAALSGENSRSTLSAGSARTRAKAAGTVDPSSPDPLDWTDMSSRLLGCEIPDNPDDALRPILQAVVKHHPGADLAILRKAYDRAVWQHRNERRRSGEPYIIHPLGVAQILADLGMTPRVVAAGLLHDTVEDTDYTLEQCRYEFGDTVAGLVDGVTKISNIEYGDSAQAETIRKLVVAMSRDVRTLVVKLADRVHNARTWRYVPTDNGDRKARETLDIYAPLANRLGMNAIKTELEELSFKQLYPKIYSEIVTLVAQRAGKRDEYLKQILDELRKRLADQHIHAYVTGRPKDYYSIYQKMVVRGHDFANIYDLVGVRIIVDSIRDCDAALGTVHAEWKPIPGRFKDYIAMPKLNMYQSLHTTVVGPGGKPVEIQIRTWEMHRRAEYGIAAHWKYKENGEAGRALSTPDSSDRNREQEEEKGELSQEDNLRWIQQLADWTSETPDSNEFLGTLKEDLSSGEVYVFTPKGKVISLPAGATPVDFAYSLHTEVGHHTMGARVNERLVPLDTRLKNGDTVEILTTKAKDAGPSRDWLNFVKSPRARAKIKQWFSKERRSQAIDDGKDELTRALRRKNLPLGSLMNEPALLGAAQDMGFGTVNSLYSALGEGKITAQTVISHLVGDAGEQEISDDIEAESVPASAPEPPAQTASGAITVKGVSGVWVKLARCCNPVPGDKIVGFITKAQGVSVHRADCVNILSLEKSEPQRIVQVSWTGQHTPFTVRVEVDALDRPHLFSDITKTLSDSGVDLIGADMHSGGQGGRVASGTFEFRLADMKHLQMLLSELRTIDGVYDAFRLTGSRESKLTHKKAVRPNRGGTNRRYRA